MKNMKKILALLVAVLMIAAMVPAMADGHSISVNADDTHTYRVFQVLTGTLANEGDKELGNPAWGADATDAAKASSVASFITTLVGTTGEKAQAELVASMVDTTGNGRGTVSAGHPIENLATGYYVLKDITAAADLKDEDSTDTLSLLVVKVVNDIDGFTVKYDSVPDDKIITTDTLGDDATGATINGKIDNVSIGDTVNYQITTKVPAKATDYNYFYFIINDTLSEGLTFTENSIHVYHGSVAQDNELQSSEYTIKYHGDVGLMDAEHTFEVALNAAKTYAGENIIVTYAAVLNANAEIGENPNPNTSTVTFSNDPHHTYDGENHPGFPAETEGDYLKETPVTRTETFTTGIKITKIDENGDILTGAEFQITGTSVQTVLVTEEYFREAEAGEEPEYYELKDSNFTKDAPTEEAMIPTPGATAGFVQDDEGTTVVAGVKYREYVPATDEGETVYVHQLSNVADYKKTVKTHVKDVHMVPKNNEGETINTKAFVGEDGVVEFVGLGAGTYTIKETTTPAGYNTLSDVTLKIEFTPAPNDGEYHWTKASDDTSDFAYNNTEGLFEARIRNNKGTQLPETGGMGTTILYIGGSILVLAAAILLITKRRMNAED